MAPGPYEQVGNVFLVYCDDHPFKHAWEVNRVLRDLRFEFKGQLTIHPDTPQVRERLFRVRHIVSIEMVALDELKQMMGVPAHITFSDLATGIPLNHGRGPAAAMPLTRSRINFVQNRRMRLRDVMERDAAELKLLKLRKEAAAKAQK
jgi:ribosomal protein L30/L7E